MLPLRRLLKKKTLAPFLLRAEQLLGPSWKLTVREADTPAPAARHSEPLHLEGETIGYLDCLASENPSLANSPCDITNFARFVADSLEQTLHAEAVKRSLAGETLGKYREISMLHRATMNLNGSLRPREAALALLGECRQGGLPAETGMIFLRQSGGDAYLPICSYGDAPDWRLVEIPHSALFADVVRTQKGELVNDLDRDARWHGEAYLRSLLLYPLCVSNRCVGMLLLGARSTGRFDASHLQYVGTLATVAGIALGNALHFEAVQALINSLMQALATAIDARDPFTAGHSQRVARLGVALARLVHRDHTFFPNVRYTPNDLEELLFAGLLHDVGKIGIREEVLTKSTRLSTGVMEVIGQRLSLEELVTGVGRQDDFKRLARINAANTVSPDDARFVLELGARRIPLGDQQAVILSEQEIACLLIPRGNLTPEERREIERHPAESHRILRHIPFPENMSRLLDIISQHHERLDGSGYPAGLKADAILLQSRIIAIVDIYDAITMARHYKPALPRQKALGILWQEARAGRIDERLVELLDTHIEQMERDSQRLDNSLDLAGFLEPATA